MVGVAADEALDDTLQAARRFFGDDDRHVAPVLAQTARRDRVDLRHLPHDHPTGPGHRPDNLDPLLASGQRPGRDKYPLMPKKQNTARLPNVVVCPRINSLP